MPNDTIDTLNIEISSNTAKAIKALDNLSQKLSGVNKALQSVNTAGLRNYARDMGKVSASIKALNGIKVNIPNLSGLSKQLENLEKVDFSKLTASAQPLKDLSVGLKSLEGLQNISIPKLDSKNINSVVGAVGKLSGIDTAKIPQISDGLTRVTHAMSVLNTVDFSDSKITTVIGSLKRLLSVDTSGFDITIFSSISSAIGALANVPDVSSSLNRLISSLAKLAGTGPSISTVVAQLPALGVALRDIVNKVASVENISDSVNLFTQSIERLASAGAKTGQTAAGLENLANETLKFFQAMTKAPKISQNTIAMTQALAQLAAAGGKVGTATGTITSAFNKLSNLGTKSANAIEKAASSMVSSFKNIGNGSKHLNVASAGFGRLFKSILPYVGAYQLFNWGKQAIEISSDLTEVQNVVDVTFGDMKQKVEDLASVSITDFGMSELTTKQISSRFQAMGVAMGFTQNKMSDMSIELTKLAADMASFYNVEQKDVAESLESIFTGQTRPLRTYGLDLTQATLQEWALKNGIEAKVASMSHAEKTLLRYQYVMANTTAAQGDFARTSDTWANQIRILSQQFEQLGSVIGGVLINAFKPFVSALNSVMQAVISFAKTVANVLGAIFGWTIEIDAGGLVNDFEAAGAGAEDIADGTGKAADNAKKLNKYITAWHEVNNMTSNNDTGSSGGGGGAPLMDMNFPDKFELEVTAKDEVSSKLDKIRERFSKLKSLFAAGFKFGLGDTSVFDSIKQNLQSIKESLINIFTDSEVGDAFNSLLDTLAFNAGAKLGAFTSIGASILDNITGGVALYLDGAKERIKKYLIDMFDIAGDIDTIITNFKVALAKISTVFQSDDAKNITASIIQIFADGFMGATELTAKIGRDILGSALNPITENADKIKESLENTLAPLSTLLRTLADSFTHTWEVANQTYDEHVAPLFQSLSDGISEIIGTILDGYNQYIAPVLTRLADRFKEVFERTIQPLLDNFIGLVGDVADLIKTVWETILQPVINWIDKQIMPVVSPVIEGMGNVFLSTFETIGKTFDGFYTEARGVITFLNGVFSGDWKKAWEGIQQVFKGVWETIPNFVKTPIRIIIGSVNKMIEAVESGINFVIQALNGFSFDVPDWVPKIGGETFGFDLDKISLGRIPQLANGGIVTRATLALIGESGTEAVVPLEKNTKWISMVSGQVAKELSNYKLNLSVPQSDFSPKSYNLEAYQTTMQMEIDARMAEMNYQNQQLRNIMEENNSILQQIKDQGIILDDNEFNRRYKSGAKKYYKQTGRQLGISY